MRLNETILFAYKNAGYHAKIIFSVSRIFQTLLSDLCLRFKTQPVYQYASHETCKYMRTQRRRLPTVPTPVLPRGCFLFTPFPPLFTRGVPWLSSFLFFFFSDGSQSAFPTESSTASGMAYRAESNGLVTLVGIPSRDRPMGLTGNRGGR